MTCLECPGLRKGCSMFVDFTKSFKQKARNFKARELDLNGLWMSKAWV